MMLMAAENARVDINGVDQGSKADSSTLTVQNGAGVSMVYGIASTTYAADYVTFTMPCSPVSSAEFSQPGSPVADANYLGAHELWTLDGSPTIDIFNGDTGNRNAGDGADNETIGSADTGRWDIKFSSAAKQAQSPIRHGLGKDSKVHVYIEVNATVWDITTQSWSGGDNPVTYEGTGAPTFVAPLTVDSQFLHYTFKGCPNNPQGISGTEQACNENLGRLQLTAKASQNPNAGATTDAAASIGTGMVKLHFAYDEFYEHTIDNRILFDVAKDDGTRAAGIAVDTARIGIA